MPIEDQPQWRFCSLMFVLIRTLPDLLGEVCLGRNSCTLKESVCRERGRGDSRREEIQRDRAGQTWLFV